MFEETRKKIGLTLTRFFFRKKAGKPMSFSTSFSRANTALVIVPENDHHRSVALPMLTLLQNKFQGNKLTLVVNDRYKELANPFARSVIVPVLKEQLNFFFLPRKSAFQRVLNQKYDVVVDLNLSLAPTGAYFLRGSNAQLKVGFTQQHADAYYNFQFNSAPNRNPKARYEQLFRTLSMF
jgi:ADP-heptose:LPS heptosyltransferase